MAIYFGTVVGYLVRAMLFPAIGEHGSNLVAGAFTLGFTDLDVGLRFGLVSGDPVWLRAIASLVIPTTVGFGVLVGRSGPMRRVHADSEIHNPRLT